MPVQLTDVLFPPGGIPGAASAGEPIPGVSPDEDGDAPREEVIERDPPDEMSEARRRLVQLWMEKVKADKAFWTPVFDRMKEDQAFAAGRQWGPDMDPLKKGGINHDTNYTANIVLRHLAQRTASIYGKNPKIIARRRERLLNTVWDGSMQSLMDAQTRLQQAAMAAVPVDPMTGAPMGAPNPMLGAAMDPEAAAILADAQQVKQAARLLDNVANTLRLVYEYNVHEQVIPFKQRMKDMVRRALTTGVGYVKLGFQRAMEKTPEQERQIADISKRLMTIERISADLADGETDPNAAEAEQLRLSLEALSKEPGHIVREGLVFDFPDSTAIIPDKNTRQLRGFVGADHVTEEYLLTGNEIKEVYGVDVSSSSAVPYVTKKDAQSTWTTINFDSLGSAGKQAPSDARYTVWEVYCRADGLVYVLCDGYPEFLREPAAPETFIERFWPWFAFVTNEVYDETAVFPPSDVRLMWDQQMEHNRARQGLREHRRANRPKMVVAGGQLEEQDKEALQHHPANAVIELKALGPGQKVEDLLQHLKGPPIDPALYDVNPSFDDILRVVGTQEANLGGTAGATATETNIAESSRVTAQGSVTDDLDELLTELARAAGQVLLLNVEKQTVMDIVGPGAVWPETDRELVAREVYLDIQAASTGRPNRAVEIQNATQLFPMLMQVPGVKPEFIVRELVRRFDDRIDLTEVFAEGTPSIQSMNRMSQMPPPGPPGADPNAQGEKGQDNQRTAPKRTNASPTVPQIPMSPAPGG